MDLTDSTTMLQHYLQRAADGLLLKTEGLSERELRMPRTPTGTSIIGIVKHCANVTWGYLGLTVGRRFPDEHLMVPYDAYDADPQADWYATESETCQGLIELYRSSVAFGVETIGTLPLDQTGRVPWWPADWAPATVEHLAVRVIDDTSRHAGQADILRELHDGAVGLHPDNDNIPAGYDWPAYVAKLTALAERY
jgi:hypothetical protein